MKGLTKMHHQIKMIKVPDKWVISGGKGVNVAVIDSQIDENSNVYKKIYKSYYLSNNGIYHKSHCTSVCSIISNVAPFCNIIVSQALFGKRGDYSGLEIAINNIMKEDVDIINFSLSTREDKSWLRDKISFLSKKSIIVASMANDGSTSYPAMYDNVVSVSSIKKSNILADIYCDDNFFFDGIESKNTGNSMSTAFISGIFALAKSFNKNMTKEDIINELLGI